MRILLVEDDSAITEVIHRILVRQGYSVDVASDGDTGLDMALSNGYDLLIIDMMLPKLDGRSLCAIVRREGCTTPVLIMTAASSHEAEVDLLDTGADDFIAKPFNLEVFQARVRSLLRRGSEHRTSRIEVGDLTIDTASRSVRRDGRTIHLTPKVFALLEYMAMNRGRVLTRDQITEHVWDMNFDPRSNVLESLMHVLRQRIERDGDRLIHTVRGVGYRFDDGAS
jgi:two-component system, OmpR family, response regulator